MTPAEELYIELSASEDDQVYLLEVIAAVSDAQRSINECERIYALKAKGALCKRR